MKISNLRGLGQLVVPSSMMRPGSGAAINFQSSAAPVQAQADARANFTNNVGAVVAACVKRDEKAAAAAAQTALRVAPSDRSLSGSIMALNRMFAEQRANRPFCNQMSVDELRRGAGGGFAISGGGPVTTASVNPATGKPYPVAASAAPVAASTPAAKIAKLSNDVLQKLYDAFVSRKVPPGIDEELKDIDANIAIIRAEMQKRGMPMTSNAPQAAPVPAAASAVPIPAKPEVVQPSIPTAASATPPVSTTKVEEVGKASAAITTIEDFKAKNPIQQAATAPAEGMSTNMKLGIAAVVAVGGFYWWKRRSA